MKLLFLNSEFPPVGAGAGNACANLARLFVTMGSEVVVVTSAFDALPGDETRDGVRILRGPARRRKIDRSGLMEQTLFIAGAWLRCVRLMSSYRPDVTLAFFGAPSGAVAWILKMIYRTPYVVSLRGGDVPGFRTYDFWLYHKLASPILRQIWHGASAVVANSAGLRRLAVAFDGTVAIPVVPNGVDVDRFVVAKRAWDSPRILSVGRIVHQKGLDLAMAALATLKDLDWEWRIVGDGPQLALLKSMLHDHGLEERIQFLGWQPAQRLEEEYARANLFLFPSRDEGMPNAVLEAMASGLPVVASKIAGNDELVVDGETGILVPLGDTGALREALRVLLCDSSKRQRMGTAGRLRAERQFSWQSAASGYQSILERAVR